MGVPCDTESNQGEGDRFRGPRKWVEVVNVKKNDSCVQKVKNCSRPLVNPDLKTESPYNVGSGKIP